MVYKGKSIYKWMIWGYPHLWKPPYTYLIMEKTWCHTFLWKEKDPFRTGRGLARTRQLATDPGYDLDKHIQSPAIFEAIGYHIQSPGIGL